ncbi:MAG: DUF2202 domain-containing protein [Geobacteraceae bacterium]|nr:DUF2202 domain-containing protein [Geobacteraceae bacterium]
MKTTASIKTAILTGLVVLTTLIAGFSNGTAWAGRFDSSKTVTVVTIPLSSTEAEMLTFMREEEKLARDVYIAMYQKWGAITFSNIAASEQQHMDTIKKMLDKYNLLTRLRRHSVCSPMPICSPNMINCWPAAQNH